MEAKKMRLAAASLAAGLWCCATQDVASAADKFTAGKSCNAYQSHVRKTNPGNVKLKVGNTYMVIEKSPDGAWQRIRIDGANPPERWVSSDCGSSSEGGAQPKKNECRTVGLGDSYVLALSWQPAFCELKPDKPECKVDDPQAYQASSFTLHGLWPNKKSCGTGYGFCGKSKDMGKKFCSYDAISVDEATDKELKKVMPSAAHGSCLERHEWNKHGTCQTTWNEDGYFDTAIRLTEEFNKGGMSELMSKNVGKTVSTQQFREAVDKAFGAGASERLELKCSGRQLVDVYIALPGELPAEAPLKDLLGKVSRTRFKNNCGQQFEVDPIGQ